MHWKKLGFVFAPDGLSDWMHSYAQVPTPVVFEDFIRVFFSCRPKEPVQGFPVAYIGYVDLDRENPTKVLSISDQPVIPLGDPGTFDEFGTHPVSAVRIKDEIRLYYVGWTRLTNVPYNRAIGLALSRDNGNTFERFGKGPVLGATHDEPYLQQGPSVRIFNEKWRMWYLSGLDWVEHHGKFESIYQVFYADSEDGIHWLREGKPVLPTIEEYECQAGQAVEKIEGRYHMWFSFRPGLDFRNAARGYRMGYAVSRDMRTWDRDDSKAGISLSKSGWDSEMICYPQTLVIEDRILMFYSGNYFGRSGFGCAELIY